MGHVDPGSIALFRSGKGGPTADFGKDEAAALRALIVDYLSLLDAGPTGADPVLSRLFPPASLDDEAVSSTFRDLTVRDLEALKRSHAQVALSCLGESGAWKGALTEEQQEAWVTVLTDLRLVIGIGEGVTEETMEAPVDPSNPLHRNLLVLHYLGALQEDLVRALGGAGGTA